MKANLTAIGLSVGLIMATQVNAKNQQVYDVNNLNSNQTSNHNQCSGLDCLLMMGTFSSEKYAERYKEHLSKKTKHPVKVERDKNDKNIFHVIVGPFNNFTQMLKSGTEMTGKQIRTTTTATKKLTTTSARTAIKTTKAAGKTTSEASLLAFNNTMPAFFGRKAQNNAKTNKMKVKRTVARDGSKTMRAVPYQTRHQKILASQADYPINQRPKADAKGNIAPLFETGPYLGVSAGVMTNIGKAPATIGYQAFPGNVSAGAAMMLTRRIYLGGEFYYGSNITAYNYTAGVNGYNMDNGWFYGGSFLPGYMLTDTLLTFIRVGVMRNQFLTSPSSSIRSYPPNSPYTRRFTLVKNGWQVGAGTQINLYKNIDGRAEYDFSYFRGLNSNTSKANINQVYLGLVYKFTDALHKA